MSLPQSGILPEGNQHALFVTLEIIKHYESLASDLAKIPELTRILAQQHPDTLLTSVVGIGSSAWDRLFPDQKPAHLTPFRARTGGSRVAPSTTGDILLHIRSERPDVNFILIRQIMQVLSGQVKVVDEVAGFRYLDSRDMTGFVDGTENPEGDARAEVALVDEDADFMAGSYINLQRYIHQLNDWDNLPVSIQEAHIGRTKVDDIELQGDAKPATAHISRVVIKENGEELEILRHSMPYGSIKEAGLLFIAYGSSPEPFDKMLDQMVGTDKNEPYDHLLNYSQAVTGSRFFAPSLDFLAANAQRSKV